MVSTQLIVTVLILAGALAVIARMVVIEKRPRTDLNPRLIPTTPVLMIGGLVALLALIHLMNMAGLHTGRQLESGKQAAPASQEGMRAPQSNSKTGY